MKSTLRNLLFLSPFLSLSFGISVASASVQKESHEMTNMNDNRAIYHIAQVRIPKDKSPKFRKKAGMRLKPQDGIRYVPKLKMPVANQPKPKPLDINKAPKVDPV